MQMNEPVRQEDSQNEQWNKGRKAKEKMDRNSKGPVYQVHRIVHATNTTLENARATIVMSSLKENRW